MSYRPCTRRSLQIAHDTKWTRLGRPCAQELYRRRRAPERPPTSHLGNWRTARQAAPLLQGVGYLG